MRSTRTLQVNVVHASPTLFDLDVALETSTLGVGLVVLLAVLDRIGDEWCPNDVVAGLRLRDVETVENRVDFVALELRVDTVLEKRIAGSGLERHDTLVGVAGHLHVPHTLRVDNLFHQCTALGCKLIEFRNIGLVQDKHGGLVGKEGLDSVEELALRLDGVPALLGEIHEVEDARLQVSKRGDTLHLDVVHLLERVVEDSRGIDDLPSHVAVVEVPNEEGLGGECVRLDVDIRTSDFVEER